jgi:putative lipase involved disintegration of autophagic bodies
MFGLKYLVRNGSVLMPLMMTLSNFKIKFGELNYDTTETLAKISYDVYFLQNSTKWIDVELDSTIDVSKDHDQVNAYIFSNSENTQHVIAFKGTSIYWQTSVKIKSSVYNDKFNDNLFYSCCYYKESSIFKNDCLDKQEKGRTCYKECYQNSTNYSLNYYNLAKDTMMIASKYINMQDDIIFTGHSLGGMLATMMGLIHNKVVVTFESPGERHYIENAGINYTKEQEKNIYHFGHNADIIFTGKCNGVTSWCYLGGYIMETKCHIGNVCEYDTKGVLDMKESIFTHKIGFVLEEIIQKWNKTIPSCKKQNCTECENWTFI